MKKPSQEDSYKKPISCQWRILISVFRQVGQGRIGKTHLDSTIVIRATKRRAEPRAILIYRCV